MLARVRLCFVYVLCLYVLYALYVIMVYGSTIISAYTRRLLVR